MRDLKMQQTNIIGDTCKNRRIDYGLIDKINKQYEREGRKEELEAKLAEKKKEKEKHAAEPTTPHDINYIQRPDELKNIAGNYSMQKGQYMIDFDIHIPKSASLILEAGVELYFTKDAGITCEGRLEARGEDGLEVLLTAEDKDIGWKNLYLKGSAEAVVDYARFSYGKGREDKDGDTIGGAALLEAEDDLKPGLRINNSCFEKNSAKYGGAIYNNEGRITIKENNIFKKNSAIFGGAIYNKEGTAAIENKNRF